VAAAGNARRLMECGAGVHVAPAPFLLGGQRKAEIRCFIAALPTAALSRIKTQGIKARALAIPKSESTESNPSVC